MLDVLVLEHDGVFCEINLECQGKIKVLSCAMQNGFPSKGQPLYWDISLALTFLNFMLLVMDQEIIF